METTSLEPDSDEMQKVADALPVEETTKFDGIIKELSENAIGQELPANLISEAQEQLAVVKRHPDYADHEEVPFTYEILDDCSAVRRLPKEIAIAWLENENNVHRLEARVGRPASKKGSALLQAFCAFRFKALKPPRWGIVEGGLEVGKHKTSAVVLVALEDWSIQNGFFCDLRRGQDICLDGSAQILLPGTGGGLGVMFGLNI